MPSKTNTKGSGAKNQAKSASPNLAGGGHGSDANTAAAPSSQSGSRFSAIDTRQTLRSNSTEADNVRPEHADPTASQTATNDPNREGGVNKKKQKRRIKEAAKRAAEENELSRETNARDRSFQGAAKHSSLYDGQSEANGYDYEASEYNDQDNYEPDETEDLYYTDEAAQRNYSANIRLSSSHVNGNVNQNQDLERDSGSKSKKKRKSKSASTGVTAASGSSLRNQNSLPHLPPPPPPPPPPTNGNAYTTPGTQNYHAQKQHKIWNTSTTEERENIKEFWLSLGEEDRRSLVKVEKEAVLKKMKEQQKYSCSCTVCGRKRTAIEEELEVLYDAYYEELEQYANHQQISLDNGAPIMPQAQLYHPMSRQRQNTPQTYSQSNPRGRLQEIVDGDDLDHVGEESDIGEEDDLSDDYEDSEDPPQNPAATDFFNFGKSLTVQGKYTLAHRMLCFADICRRYTDRCRRSSQK